MSRCKDAEESEGSGVSKKREVALSESNKYVWDKYTVFWLMFSALLVYGGIVRINHGGTLKGITVLVCAPISAAYSYYLLKGGSFRSINILKDISKFTNDDNR